MAKQESPYAGMTGEQLRSAMKKLSHGSLNFAFGYKDPKTPMLLVHPTKSARTLIAELKSEGGATKTACGTAKSAGKALVLDVDGAPVSGMGRMVKTLLRKEKVSGFDDTKVCVGGADVEGGSGDAPSPQAAAPKPQPTATGGPDTDPAWTEPESTEPMAEASADIAGSSATGEARAGGSKGSGSVYKDKTSEGDAEVLHGEYEVTPDGQGGSASGYVAQSRSKGDVSTIGQGEVKSGKFTDDKGNTTFDGAKVSVAGAKREVDLAQKYGLPDWVVLKADEGVGTASAEKSIRDDGATLGVGANVAEGSVTLGTKGTGDQDQSLRVGLSEGEGAAGRLHWGDEDKDGNPEYGFGFDAGPVSADLKTEDPLRKALEVGGGPVASLVTPLIPGNLTNDAVSEVKDLAKGAEGLLDDILN